MIFRRCLLGIVYMFNCGDDNYIIKWCSLVIFNRVCVN